LTCTESQPDEGHANIDFHAELIDYLIYKLNIHIR